MNFETKVLELKQKFFFDEQTKLVTGPLTNYRYRSSFNLHKKNTVICLEKNSLKTLEISSNKILKIIPYLLTKINTNNILKKKIFRIDCLANTNNDVIIALIYHKKLDSLWVDAAKQLNLPNIIGISKKQKIILNNDFVMEHLKLSNNSLIYKHTYGLFTQVNPYINCQIIEWLILNTTNFKQDLLELYCGSGNFTLALSKNFNKILATEVVKQSIKNAEYNKKRNNIKNVHFVRMSSIEIEAALTNKRPFNRLPIKIIKRYNFETILVNPPRSGLDSITLEFLKKFKNIIYISCNPESLARDINLLSNYGILESAIFDQFPQTKHIECGLILRSKLITSGINLSS